MKDKVFLILLVTSLCGMLTACDGEESRAGEESIVSEESITRD